MVLKYRLQPLDDAYKANFMIQVSLLKQYCYTEFQDIMKEIIKNCFWKCCPLIAL